MVKEEGDLREIKDYKADAVISKIKEIVRKASGGACTVEDGGISQIGATQLRILEIKHQQQVLCRYSVVVFSKEGEHLNADWIAGIDQIPSDLKETIKGHFRTIT